MGKASFVIGVLVIGFWALWFIGPSAGFDYLAREDTETLGFLLVKGAFLAGATGVALGVWGLLLRKARRWAVGGIALNLVPILVMCVAPLLA